jgi:hypothetical protein
MILSASFSLSAPSFFAASSSFALASAGLSPTSLESAFAASLASLVSSDLVDFVFAFSA